MKKKFDCVELQHQGALKIYEETKNFTREQELEYWREKDRQMAERHRKWAEEDSRSK